MRHGGMREFGCDTGIVDESGGDKSGYPNGVQIRGEKQYLTKYRLDSDAEPQGIEAEQKADDVLFCTYNNRRVHDE